MKRLAVLLLLGACADVPATEPTQTTSSDRPEPSDVAESPRADVDAGPDDAITLAGVLRTDLGEPLAGRRFVVVDRHHERRDSVSGPNGELALAEIAAPYDLRVDETVWLGLERSDPYVELRASGAEAFAAPPETFTVGVIAPPCGQEECIVEVESTSLSGHGYATVQTSANADGDAVGTAQVQHVWSTRRPVENERIDVHVIVRDSGRFSFAYTRFDSVLARAGDAVDLGFQRATTLPMTSRLTLVGRDGATLDVSWDLPGHDGIPGPSFAIFEHVPIVPGGSWRVKASIAESPSASELHRSSQAWSGSLAVGSDPPALPLPVGPEITRPIAGGKLSASGAGLSWSAAAGTLSTIDMLDTTRGAYRYRLITNENDFSFVRLALLGVANLLPGNHTMELSASPATPIDDATSPDPAVRGRNQDERRAGSATYERIAFTVIE